MNSPQYKCKDCNQEFTIISGEYDNYGYCAQCYKIEGIIREEGACCKFASMIFVKHTINGGRFQLKKQCEYCATSSNNSYPFKMVKDINELPESNFRLEHDIQIKRQKEINDTLSLIRQEFKEKLGCTTDYEGDLIHYVDYIKSPQWKEKRKLVLQRDKYICKSCLNAKATEVHHISYRHLTNEPLFELVSVCRDCHQTITNMDHGSEAKIIIHNKLLENSLNF